MGKEDFNLTEKNKEIEISEMEVNTIVKKIMNLSINKLDELWFNSGWIDEEAKQDNRKALPNWKLDKIKNNYDFARESFINFITDSPYTELRCAAEIISNLKKFSSNSQEVTREEA